ncbi:MAG: hypothetical protein MJK04_00770 [Psychrosphaera sp.]|nr:hypothetical protein [Psychrosphaera sp.]
MKHLTLSLLLALPTANALATNLMPIVADEDKVPVLNNDIRMVDNNVQSLHSYTQSQSGNTLSVVGAPATPSTYPGNGGNSYRPVALSYTIPYYSVSGATYYKLYESTTDSNYSEVYSGSSLSASFTHYSSGYRYYKYKACNSAGCSGLSPWRRMYIYTTPSKPNNLGVSPYSVTEGTSYNVSWTPSSGAVDGTVYSLYERFNNGNIVKVATKTRQHWSETSYSYSTSKQADGQYDYLVDACSPDAGCSAMATTYQTVIDAPVSTNTAPTAVSRTVNTTACQTRIVGGLGTDAEDNDTDLNVHIISGSHSQLGYTSPGEGGLTFYPYGCLGTAVVIIGFYITDSQGVRSAEDGTVTFMVQ